MKNKNVIFGAGVVIAVLLLIPSFAITATAAWDEEPQFPDELPFGLSCLAAVVARRDIDFWTGRIHDVGFSVYLMRIRDDDAHWAQFEGTAEIEKTDGTIETVPINHPHSWSGTWYLPFDIYGWFTYTRPAFKTMTLTGTITKDLGSPQTVHRVFHGRHSGGVGGNGSCFLAGTKITMADGSYKNIEDIQSGDLVQSYDTHLKQDLIGIVTEKKIHTPDKMTPYYIVINDDLQVTPNHLLYMDNEWVYAGDLIEGMSCSNDEIDSIQQINQRVTTYDLVVQPLSLKIGIFSDNMVQPIPPIYPTVPYYANNFLAYKGASYSEYLLRQYTT